MEQINLARFRALARRFYGFDQAAGPIASGMVKRLITGMSGLLLIAASSLVIAQNWQPGQYSVKFEVGGTNGVVKALTAVIKFDDRNLTSSSCVLSMPVASINTGNGLMNRHLQSAEWFDASKYPTIRYVSQKVTRTPDGFQVTGILEMHGVRKQVVIPFTFVSTGTGGVFASTFKLNRNDYHIGKPGDDADSNVLVTMTVPVTKR